MSADGAVVCVDSDFVAVPSNTSSATSTNSERLSVISTGAGVGGDGDGDGDVADNTDSIGGVATENLVGDAEGGGVKVELRARGKTGTGPDGKGGAADIRTPGMVGRGPEGKGGAIVGIRTDGETVAIAALIRLPQRAQN